MSNPENISINFYTHSSAFGGNYPTVHYTRGMFRPFHAHCTQIQRAIQNIVVLSKKKYLWGSVHIFLFMKSSIWTLEPWNDFEVAGKFLSWLLSIRCVMSADLNVVARNRSLALTNLLKVVSNFQRGFCLLDYAHTYE